LKWELGISRTWSSNKAIVVCADGPLGGILAVLPCRNELVFDSLGSEKFLQQFRALVVQPLQPWSEPGSAQEVEHSLVSRNNARCFA
jgi:hypothetical protein